MYERYVHQAPIRLLPHGRRASERVYMRRRLVSAAAAVLLVPLLQALPTNPASAAPPPESAPSDTRELTRTDFTLDGQPVDVPDQYTPSAKRQQAAAGVTPPVGTVRSWLGLDDFNGTLYRKDYTLRGDGENIDCFEYDHYITMTPAACGSMLAISI